MSKDKKDKLDNSTLSTIGFESKFTIFKMTAKRQIMIFVALILAQFLAWVIMSSLLLPDHYFYYTVKYFESSILAGTGIFSGINVDITYNGTDGAVPAAKLAAWLIDVAGESLVSMKKYFMLSLLVYPVGFVLANKYYLKHGKDLIQDKHIRGVKLIDEKELAKQMEANKEKTDFQIGGTSMPVTAECKHSLTAGRIGTGKTTAMLKVMSRSMARGDKGLIYDYKGDFVEHFYSKERGDVVFNPLDSRCCGWSVLNEVQTKMDIENIAASIIPDAKENKDSYFNTGARDIFAGMLFYLKKNDKTSNRDIWNMIVAPKEETAEKFTNTPGCERARTYFDEADDKSYASVYNTMMQYVKVFEYMAHIDGDFSLRKWIEEGKGWIFVTNRETEKETLRPILSLMIDLLSRRALDLSNDLNRRLFFFLDEFGTLQKLTSIVSLLTGGRSRGVSVWIGIQDIGAITNIYGEHTRQTIVNALTTKILFGVSEPDTAKYLSQIISTQEVSVVSEGQSWGPALMRDGMSVNRSDKDKALVTAAELIDLKELHCYVKYPNYDVTLTILPNTNGKPNDEYPIVAERFTLRPDLATF